MNDSTMMTTLASKLSPLFDILSNSSLVNIQYILDLIKNGTYDFNGCLVNCTNHGQCMLDLKLKEFICKCNTNFIGPSCQKDIRPCSSMPCMNNGTCIKEQNGTNEFRCECQKSLYEGRYCEKRVNLCENRTCSMNGICWNVTNSVYCKCFIGYSGNECELEDIQAKILRESVKYTSLVVFITCLLTFVFIVVCNDVLSFFGIGDRSKITLKRGRKSFKYYNRNHGEI